MATTPQIQRTNLKLILFVRNKTSVIRNKHSFSPEELGILAKLPADATAHLFGGGPAGMPRRAENLEPVWTCGGDARPSSLPIPRTGNPWRRARANEQSLPFFPGKGLGLELRSRPRVRYSASRPSRSVARRARAISDRWTSPAPPASSRIGSALRWPDHMIPSASRSSRSGRRT